MDDLEVFEYSIALDYVLAHRASSESFVIFSHTISDAVVNVIKVLFTAFPLMGIEIVIDEDKAKQMSNSPQWLKALSEM